VRPALPPEVQIESPPAGDPPRHSSVENQPAPVAGSTACQAPGLFDPLATCR
jgi:hypothetical protein